MPVAVWGFWDVLILVVGTILLALIGVLVAFSVFGKGNTSLVLISCLWDGALILGPILWLRKKYGLSLNVLGLQNGSLGVFTGVLVGVCAGLVWTFGISELVRKADPGVALRAAHYPHYLLLSMLFTFNGFHSIVVAPISEEIMFRGFVYGYLRKRLGIIAGLLAQAFIFGVLHLSQYRQDLRIGTMVSYLIVGVILGLLYERTGSLIASIACHSVTNYFSWVFIIVSR